MKREKTQEGRGPAPCKRLRLLTALLLAAAYLLPASAGPARAAVVRTRPPQKQTDAGSHAELIRLVVRAYDLLGETKYDEALTLAYEGLRLSREQKEGLLEISMLRLVAGIHLKVGDNYLGTKLMFDSFTNQLTLIHRKGFTQYHLDELDLMFDFLTLREDYLFAYMKSDAFLGKIVNGDDSLVSLLKEPLPEGTPPEAYRAIANIVSQLEKAQLELFNAERARDLPKYKAAVVRQAANLERALSVLAEVGPKIPLEEGQPETKPEEMAAVRKLAGRFTAHVKAVVKGDRKAARATLEVILKAVDEEEKKNEDGDGRSIDESLAADFEDMIADLRRDADYELREEFSQLFTMYSSRSALNVNLLHFMKADRGIEPTLRRYGYVTFSDLEPYKREILKGAELLQSRAARQGEEAERDEGDEADGEAFDEFMAALPKPGARAKEQVEEKTGEERQREFTAMLPKSISSPNGLIVMASLLTPEGRWLYSDSASHLLAAREEITALAGEAQSVERLVGVDPDFSENTLLLRRALLHYDEKNPEKSREHLRRALEAFQRRGDTDSVWQVHFMLGLERKHAGDIAGAIASFKQAAAAIETMRSSFRAENMRALVLDDKIFVYEFLIDLLVAAGRNDEALTYVEKTKARVLLDRLLDPRQKLFPRLKAPAGARAQRALDQSRELRQAKLRGDLRQSDQEAEALGRKIAAEDENYEAALEELRYTNPEFASIVSGETLSLAEIQKLLDDRTVILEYFIGAEKTYILLVRNRGPVESFVVARTHAELESEISAFREAVEVESASFPALARELYQTLISPVEGRIGGKRLCIVPHGATHFLPFHALLKGDRYLIQDFPVFYSSSSSVLKYVATKRRAVRGEISVVADPELNLSHAAEEVRQIAALFPRASVLQRQDATKQKVLGVLAGAGILHFATHGEMNMREPLLSGLVLARGERLTTADLYGLELAAELVTLSACETHLGKLTAGDELIGLTRAFIFAGVPSVVTSLWRVEDASTTRLMVTFYSKLIKGGATKGDALRQAQLEMLQSAGRDSHPRRWAPFILVGDFQ